MRATARHVDTTGLSLRTAAVMLAGAVLVHGLDHLRRGMTVSPLPVMIIGTVQAVVVFTTVFLVFRGVQWAPHAAMVVGFGSALLFIFGHMLPGFSPDFSDSFVSEPNTHVNWFSWVTAVLEIGAGIAFGVVGARELRAAEGRNG